MAGPNYEDATEALVVMSRTMTAVVARTLGQLDTVTVPQLRALVLVATRGPMNLTVLADHLGVNASNASRTSDRLVSAGLMHRSWPQRDRRSIVLSLSPEGEALVSSLLETRRALLGTIVERMTSEDQQLVVEAVGAVRRAIEQSSDVDLDETPDGRLIPWLL